MQHVGRNHKKIQRLHTVGLALPEVDGIGTEHNADLIEGMEMLELHVVIRVTGVVIKKIKQAVALPVYPDEILIPIKHLILKQHPEFLPFPCAKAPWGLCGQKPAPKSVYHRSPFLTSKPCIFFSKQRHFCSICCKFFFKFKQIAQNRKQAAK